jgi:hypothetical protein
VITVAVITGLVPIALWLWMARANGQGRAGARSLSTVLFGLGTLQLIGQASAQQQAVHAGFGVLVVAVIVPVLGWLAGLAAVCLLWLPASSAFFRSQASVPVPPAWPRPPGLPQPGQFRRLL